MSTIDPDARGRAIQETLRPIALAASVVAFVVGPVLALIANLTPEARDWVGAVAGYLIWLFTTVGVGLFVFYTVRNLSIFGSVAWLMGMLASGGIIAIQYDDAAGHPATWATVTFAVAGVVLYGLRLERAALSKSTLLAGVTTNATVTRSAVSGTYNSVQIWHVTLKFTDQAGTTRYLRTHLLGAGGWAPGDIVPIRYDPTHPGSRRRIVVYPDTPGGSAFVR
ncbi:MAG: DUF3592 domain-containing protein [Pseudolysinimonas sp.]